ncbi:MAG: TraB/GumN family protein [Duncaniella sp.]|uniref:TraB/GumN family protein n=1 Tax=Duncaniella sp. TaxID=2518496 RepID=UPI0023D4918C|nr:TraB/GumN family protein [Duncaniella sp.]MDE6091291.1 TraB/GumN family protein [Duncaniella sp.]
MKKILLSLVISVISTLACNAQLLWEVSGNGLSKPSYLFGTHHIAPISVLDSVPGFNSALATADKVYGEMVMSVAQSPQSQQIMMGYAAAPQDSLLTAVLAPAQLDSLDTMLKRYMGPMVSVNQFAPLKPAMLNTLLALLQSQTAFPTFNAAQQLDGEIQKRAEAAGKEVGGFETIDDQCKAMFGSSIVSQANELMDMVRNDDKSAATAIRLAKAYLSGDLDAMLAIMEDPELGSDGEWTERMLNKRNANWLRIMAGLLPTASVLIAVGAGHLPGDKGLINLLRNEGYTVKPVE